MSGRGEVRFGFTVAPVGAAGTSDADMYREVLVDCELGQSLGYDSAWFLEHHFTDYFPTPSPMVHMAHVAGRLPDLSLGTAVLVTPWYHPIRFAEEVAMLSVLSERPLHLGLGRGTAKLEYDAWGVDQEEARDRFRECLEITRLAHTGEPFSYQGTYFTLGRTVPTRPKANTERINFYGAIGSPGSAGIMAELDLAPMGVANFPLHIMKGVIDTWETETERLGRALDRDRPLMIQAWIADTDAEARALAKRWVPPFFALQAAHYEADQQAYKDIKGYEQFAKFFANLQKLADPANLDPWLDLQLAGTPQTAARGLQSYIDMGFSYFVIQVATVGIARPVRHDMLRRFAEEVAPAFSRSFGGRKRAAAE